MDTKEALPFKTEDSKQSKLDMIKMIRSPLCSIPCCTGCFSVLFVLGLLLFFMVYYLLTSY